MPFFWLKLHIKGQFGLGAMKLGGYLQNDGRGRRPVKYRALSPNRSARQDVDSLFGSHPHS